MPLFRVLKQIRTEHLEKLSSGARLKMVTINWLPICEPNGQNLEILASSPEAGFAELRKWWGGPPALFHNQWFALEKV